MRIVFIDPPHTYLMQQKTQAPLGLMYMAAVLEKHGYDVVISRPGDENEQNWERDIPGGDLYGLSATSFGYGTACHIARFLKRNRPGAVVIIGGYHVTCEKDTVQKEEFRSGVPLWDSLCIGEGERAIVQIIKDVETKQLKPEYHYSLEPDLDSLPFPARHLVADQGSNIFAYDMHYTENKLSTVISSSRGCPFSCIYCATNSMWDRKTRFRSCENVFAEIQQCIQDFNIREFRFSDELFTIHKQRTKKLMEYFAQEQIHFKCSTRVDCVDEDMLVMLKQGGCKEIAFGIESADPAVRSVIRKKTTNEQIEKALIFCDKIGIHTRVLLMIGTPGERLETADLNIAFLEKVPYTAASLSIFKPLPGSASWIYPEKYGIEILSRDLSQYNIYLWRKGIAEPNTNKDILRILSLPSVEVQIANQMRMVDYFLKTERMNEIKRAKQQIEQLRKVKI